MRSALFSYIFGIILLFLPDFSFACVCAYTGDFSIEKMEDYDYVALIKVGKLIPPVDTNDKEELPRFFEAEIFEINRFKGESMSKIKVFGGHRDFQYQTSCDLGIDTGEEWIVFGERFEGEIIFSYCSHTTIYKTEIGLRQWQYLNGIKELTLLDSTYNKESRDYLELDKDSIFYENGKLERAQQFKNGKLHGKVTYLYPDGQSYGFVSFKNGVQHGPYRWMNSNGSINLEGRKRRGKDFKKRIFYKLSSQEKSPSMISYFDRKGNLKKFLDFGYDGQKSYLSEKTNFNRNRDRIVKVFYSENGKKNEVYISGFSGNQIDLIRFDEKGKRID